MTIRQFKFTGSNNAADSAGTISINGNTVFSGPFTGEGINGEIIASGSVDIDNALAVNNQISAPTVVTVTAGSIFVALTQWDYAQGNNPVFTPEQIVILDNPATTREEALVIYQPVAVPPLSTVDEAMLLSTDPEDAEARRAVLTAHNLLTRIQDPAIFAYGSTPAYAQCNRANVLLNGVEPPGANTNVGILVQAGDVLTYNSIVYSSAIPVF